jgi:purine-nucleoside phosphorylase
MSIHIKAELGEIAPLVLMPGDPLRAKFIAENWLSDLKLVSSTRNIYFYTGSYHGKTISIGASGMGCPSIGIYSYELFAFYGVETIVRIGTAGAYDPTLNLMDLVLVDQACSESTFAEAAFHYDEPFMMPSKSVCETIQSVAKEKEQKLIFSNVHSSDVFYRKDAGTPEFATKHNCKAVEMEAFALFANARFLNKKAASLLTISDVIPLRTEISPDQREKALVPMIELALESAIQLV